MKTIKFLGTILCVVLASFATTSCGGDDETVVIIPEQDTNPVPTPTPSPTAAKKLIKIVEEEYEDGGTNKNSTTFLFDYDEEGRVNYAKINDSYGYTSVDVAYEEDEIEYGYSEIHVGGPSYYGEVSMRVSEGKIIYAVDDNGTAMTNYNFSYNSKGRIDQFSWNAFSWGESTSFTWSGDKLVRSHGGDAAAGEGEVLAFKYSGKTCKAFNPMLLICYQDALDHFLPLIAQPEWIGAKTTQLFDSYTEEDETCTLTYTMDAAGYVKKCTTVWYDYDGSIDERDVYTFTWE
ncbi:MAG: DUF4595 domain-containing protein [Paraprevotella sp.]|nr:DUF4595 domain-containing protein [Paraprevotella sp.]